MKPDHCPLHGIPLQYDGRCWTCDYNAKYKFQLVEPEPRMGLIQAFFCGAGAAAVIIIIGALVKSCVVAIL